MFLRIRQFLEEHWKICFAVCLCVTFFAVGLITYIRNNEKRAERANTMNYEDSVKSDKIYHTLHVDAGNAKEIAREIRYIHGGKTSPDVTYYVTAPTVEEAATRTVRDIDTGNAELPPAAVEKTDRTLVTADTKRQQVDVYKINLRKDHKIKAGLLQVDGKTYAGIGYQAGRWEGAVYTRDGRGIQAGTLMYTVTQW